MDKYINDADTIFADAQNRINTPYFKSLSSEAQLEFYQKRYTSFGMTFPVVLRYMIQLGLYDRTAFTRYIERMTLMPYRSELEYCERQADYIMYLYSAKLGGTDNQDIWKETYDLLVKELAMFKQANETVKKRIEQNSSTNNDERRSELKKLLDNNTTH